MQHTIEQSFLRDLKTHKKGEAVTVLQQYHIDCWNTYGAIEASLEKLELSEDCIMHAYLNAPQDLHYARLIEYHIENYLIRSRSIYDRVLIFTNALCDIQMSHDCIDHNVIITNKKVQNHGLKNSLKRISRVCSTYRVDRNAIVHTEKYNDEHLGWADTALKAKKIMGEEKFKEAGLTDQQISERIAYAVSNHIEEFKSNTKSITDRVNEFMDLAEPIYDARATAK